MQLSDLLSSNTATGAGKFQVRAGEAISQNDAVELGPSGLAWRVQCTDTATVANAGSQIVAPTQLYNGKSTLGQSRQPLVLNAVTGDIFETAPNNSTTSGYGLSINRYAAAGNLLGTISIDTVAATIYFPRLLALANGNVAVTYSDGTNIKHAVVDQNLSSVKAATVIESVDSGQYHDSIPLSGGGYMLTYLKNGTATERLAVYDNTGATVTAPFTVQTWTGTAGTVRPRLQELSNQNVVATYGSGFSTTFGLYQTIVGPTGTNVLSPTLIDSAIGSSVPAAQISAMAGYYAISQQDGTNLKTRVYSNAGAIQGAARSVTYSNQNPWTYKLLNDTTQFFVLYQDGTNNYYKLDRIQTSGGASATTTIAGTTAVNNGTPLDAFYERGRITAMHTNATGAGSALYYFVVNASSLVVEKDTTAPTGSPGGGTTAPTLLPLGDFSFVVGYDVASNGSAQPATDFYCGKYANSAISGVALAATSAGSLVSVGGGKGQYVANFIKGSASKAFDHSSANINGNKGALMSYGASFGGY